jgi:hypothetical protein
MVKHSQSIYKIRTSSKSRSKKWITEKCRKHHRDERGAFRRRRKGRRGWGGRGNGALPLTRRMLWMSLSSSVMSFFLSLTARRSSRCVRPVSLVIRFSTLLRMLLPLLVDIIRRHITPPPKPARPAGTDAEGAAASPSPPSPPLAAAKAAGLIVGAHLPRSDEGAAFGRLRRRLLRAHMAGRRWFRKAAARWAEEGQGLGAAAARAISPGLLQLRGSLPSVGCVVVHVDQRPTVSPAIA